MPRLLISLGFGTGGHLGRTVAHSLPVIVLALTGVLARAGGETLEKCPVELRTEPVGAEVLIGGTVRGVAPLTYPADCGERLEFEFRLNGFESFRDSILVRRELRWLKRDLTPTQFGLVSLTLNQNAKVLWQDKELAEIMAGNTIEIRLPVGENQILRFVNEKLKIDEQRAFTVTRDRVVKHEIDLRPVRSGSKR